MYNFKKDVQLGNIFVLQIPWGRLLVGDQQKQEVIAINIVSRY